MRASSITMNSLDKQRYISTFVRLLLIFFLVTIPLYAVSIYANRQGAENVKGEIGKSTLNQVAFYLSDFESEITRITETQARYIDDVDFKRLSLLGPALETSEQIESLNGIRGKLLLLKSTSKYIENIRAYIPAMGMTMDSAGYMQPCCPADTMAELFSESGVQIRSQNGMLLLTQSSSYILSDSEAVPAYGISAQLSRERIENSLLDFIQYKQGSALLMSHDDGWSIRNCSGEAVEGKPESFFWELMAETDSRGIRNISIEKQPYLVAHEFSPKLRLSLMVFVPETAFLHYLQSYNNWMKLISLVTALVLVAFSVWLYGLMERPLVELVDAFRKVENGDLTVEIAHSGNDEFTYLYGRFNKMVRNLKNLMVRAYEQEIRAKNAELKQLQYQINPHFLYNSIFIIYRMTKRKDIDTIEKLSRHLGEYYRFVTRSSAGEIPLADEVTHAGNYIEVQRIRFGNRIEVRMDEIPPGRESFIVPRLILQPIVENCYNHGLKHKEEGGLIELSFVESADRLVLQIDDNGDDLSDEDLIGLTTMLSRETDELENTGILNIHRRLAIFYGEGAGIEVARSKHGGLSTRVVIPLSGEG